MKKAVAVALVLVPAFVFAEEAPTDVPAWLQMVMDFIVAIPGVGPIVLEVLKWLGVVASVMTALSTALMAVSEALKKVGIALGFSEFAAKIDELYKKIWPYIAWLSIYNNKKKA